MNNNVENALDDVISVIKNSKEYQKCISLKEKMNSNDELTKLIEEIKTLQKKYVKSNFEDDNIKEELSIKEDKLNNIPLYVEYNNSLEVVNEMIDTVKEELNDYFNKKVNILK